MKTFQEHLGRRDLKSKSYAGLNNFKYSSLSRYILSFLCFLCLIKVARAQDFEPSQEAQGYLDAKNMVVDYATGIFHYKIPLFNIETNGFQLPINLEYSAKGVKAEDTRGLIGCNWSLNTGGVVTRIIRGGIADETTYYGFLWAAERNDSKLLEDDVINVNKRERDGECDIFTAVFNGQSVNFIIKMDNEHRIYAEPLEKTNVRILCESPDGREINGWIVIDDSGNRYIYRQKEWSADIIKEDAISFNGVREKSYISSWYLNKIEPCNSGPIVFNYLEDVSPYGDQTGINITEYYFSYGSKYKYGRSMREREYDVSDFKTRFNEEITRARGYLNNFVLEEQVKNMMYEYISWGNWAKNPGFENGVLSISNNFRVMGQLANFSYVSNASSGLIKTLNNLIEEYGSLSSVNARQAAECFRRAKSYVIESLTGNVADITTNKTWSGTRFYVRSPILQNIVFNNKVVELVYDGSLTPIRLSGVKLLDIFFSPISEVTFEGQDQLNCIRFMGYDSVEVNHMKFEYYEKVPNIRSDAWGYPIQNLNLEDEEFSQAVSTDDSKIGSLKAIMSSNKGKIIIDYESNCHKYIYDFGGIRVKSVITKDIKGNANDTVYYRYPLLGLPVFNHCSNSEVVSYNGFSDNILHSRVKYTNMPIINTGNNGLYYPYVQKIIPGKGMTAFLFNVSADDGTYPYSFWLNGLPLGIAMYDNNGNLKRLVKYKYLSDLSGGRGTEDYFSAIDTALNYKYKIPQVKAYEYYMDENLIESYYKRQGRILLYQDGSYYCYMNPYNDVYLPNISPRTDVHLPNQIYNIRYGGKTLLSEELEYRFEGHVTDSASISDFKAKTIATPYLKTKYIYDNMLNSSYPIRTVKIDAKGDSYTTIIKRVSEMDNNVSSDLVKMRENNILSPVIKKIQLKDDVIQTEEVLLYNLLEVDSICNIGLSKQYVFYPTSDKNLLPPSLAILDKSLFTYGQDNYILEKDISYRFKDNIYLPVKFETNSESKVFCHDFNYDKMILNVASTQLQGSTAVDLRSYNQSSYGRAKASTLIGFYQVFMAFTKMRERIDVKQQSEEFQRYVQTRGHQRMMELINVIVFNKQVAYENYKFMVKNVRADGDKIVTDFLNNYQKLEVENRDLNGIWTLTKYIYDQITQEKVLDTDFFKFRYFIYRENCFGNSDTLKITNFPESKCMRLFVVAKDRRFIHYSIEHAGGHEMKRLELIEAQDYIIQIFDIDMKSYNNLISLKVDKPSDRDVLYIALVPADVPFEATSYNLDGSIFCKFNHNGQAEFYEYDGAGRVIKIYDRNRNITKEMYYNNVIQ